MTGKDDSKDLPECSLLTLPCLPYRYPTFNHGLGDPSLQNRHPHGTTSYIVTFAFSQIETRVIR